LNQHDKAIELKRKKFKASIDKYVGAKYDRHTIGILNEKTIHSVVKDYFSADEDLKEVPVGSFFADICDGDNITEIQTAGFGKLRDKLTYFLPDYKVTLVYPMQHFKWTIWVDPESGELNGHNKSPITGNVYRAFKELYRIKTFLKHPNLRVIILLIDMDEYRLLDGWSQNKKRGSHRYDRIPLELIDEIEFADIYDYMALVPDALPEEFTGADLAKAVHIKSKEASVVMNILSYMGAITQTGKRGRAYLYSRYAGEISEKASEPETDVDKMLEDLHIDNDKKNKRSKRIYKKAVSEKAVSKKTTSKKESKKTTSKKTKA
jgi:hypothetical protein